MSNATVENILALPFVSQATEEARALGHDWIGTEHLLLGLLKDDSVAGTLGYMGQPIDQIRQAVLDDPGVKPKVEPVRRTIQFTPRVKLIFKLSLIEPDGDPVEHIGPEHVVFGILRERDGIAAEILSKFGITHYLFEVARDQ